TVAAQDNRCPGDVEALRLASCRRARVEGGAHVEAIVPQCRTARGDGALASPCPGPPADGVSAERRHEGWWGRYESGTYDRVAPVSNARLHPLRGEVSLMSAVPESPSRPTVTEQEARQVAEAAREQD